MCVRPCRACGRTLVKRRTVPVYEYEHREMACAWGRVFEVSQSIQDAPLEKCPHCGGPVKRIISVVGVSIPKTNAELKDLGFTKLVRRDDGVYENVTARDGDTRYMERSKPETVPRLSKTISD